MKTQTRWRRVIYTCLSFVAAISACSDTPVQAPSLPYLPIRPRIAALRGSVDLTTGTMTFDSAPTIGMASGLYAQIYGVQSVSVRLYNSTVQIDSITTPGVKRITAMVGIENLLGHSIGDEQAGLVPGDTMGVYVFFTDEPTVTSPSPCSSCSVAIMNYHGTLAFTDLGQKYFHWPERLGAAGSITDTTLNRKLWTFESSAAVTNFTFTVLVSEAWPPPDETAWQVEYTGDSLPDLEAEPGWRRRVTSVGASATAGPGTLSISVPTPVVEAVLIFRGAIRWRAQPTHSRKHASVSTPERAVVIPALALMTTRK